MVLPTPSFRLRILGASFAGWEMDMDRFEKKLEAIEVAEVKPEPEGEVEYVVLMR